MTSTEISMFESGGAICPNRTGKRHWQAHGTTPVPPPGMSNLRLGVYGLFAKTGAPASANNVRGVDRGLTGFDGVAIRARAVRTRE